MEGGEGSGQAKQAIGMWWFLRCQALKPTVKKKRKNSLFNPQWIALAFHPMVRFLAGVHSPNEAVCITWIGEYLCGSVTTTPVVVDWEGTMASVYEDLCHLERTLHAAD